MGHYRGKGRRVATALLLLWSAQAAAQEPSPPATNDPAPPIADPPAADPPADDTGKVKLEKVVVTANKREQLLTDVPMAVSAISGQDLEKDGDTSFIDYAQKIPTLNFGYYGEGRQRISLRGLQAPTGVSTVAYLVDGIEQGEQPPDLELFDISQIEVLRGPQGTLYGAGAVGGAIKIITNRANAYAWQVKGLGSISQSSPGALSNSQYAMANAPLIKGELGARVVGFRRHSDGYITIREPDFNNPPGLKSYSSETILAENANFTDVRGGRLALDWRATQDLAFGVKYSTEQRDAGYGPTQSIDADEKYGGYNFKRGSTPQSGDLAYHEYRQTTFNVNWKLPFAALESVTGVADVKEDLELGTFVVLPVVDTGLSVIGQPNPIPIRELPSPLREILQDAGLPTQLAVGDMFEFDLINSYSYISQELRLVSLPSTSPLTWTGGLFYKIGNRTAYANIYAGPVLGDALNGNEDGTYQKINLHFETREAAAYGQLEYAITDKLTALAGVRYYRADLKDTAVGAGADGLVFTPRFNDVSPKFTVSYHFTETLLGYATAAKGFRIGGINFSTTQPQPENFQRTYDPDVLWNYEVGVNSTLFDGRVSASFAVFNAVWKNLQDEVIVSSNAAIAPGEFTPGNPLAAFQPGGTERMVINAGQAYSRGVEGEVTMLLPLELTWTLSGAYIDAALDEDTENPATGGVIPAGTSLENVPEFAGSTSLTHDLRFAGGWGIETSVAWSYRGETHADITNPTESVASAYSLIDLRIGVHGKGSRWSADAFVKNLTDERASSFTFNHSATTNALADRTDSPVGYRTIGLRANVSF